MVTIPVRVCGDQWVNPQEVADILENNVNDEFVVLDMGTEGPSLKALGIVDLIKRHIDSSKVYVDHWHNVVEPCEFTRLNNPRISHFFWMCEKYRIDPAPLMHERFLFGFFVGRMTLPRARMLWDLKREHNNQCLLSLMRQHGQPTSAVDTWEEWFPDDKNKFLDWWGMRDVRSLDGHTVAEQYMPGQNTNKDLLAHYGRFDIEIVAETYTRGETFFPTEKTIRPITATKAMLIHGPQNYLQRLAELGFRTWKDLWDESYDQFEGAERWEKMLSTINLIKHQDQTCLQHSMQDINQHNLQVLEHLIEKYKPR